MRTISILLLGFCLGMAGPGQARDLTDEELEKWFESNDPLPAAHSVAHVNGGSLVFLRDKPAREVHHHQNHLVISPQSLDSGWVWLAQCHDNLDKVARAQIMYPRERIRDLQIVTSEHIAESRVENHSVQLRDVGAGARLCVTAWTQALKPEADGSYSMVNGPFMRRFLDGYYPMQVTVSISFADTDLDLVSIWPEQQDGFAVDRQAGSVSFEAWFEGQLRTELMFRKKPS